MTIPLTPQPQPCGRNDVNKVRPSLLALPPPQTRETQHRTSLDEGGLHYQAVLLTPGLVSVLFMSLLPALFQFLMGRGVSCLDSCVSVSGRQKFLSHKSCPSNRTEAQY